MKKIILSFLALIAMVGTTSAQRVWAYGLNMESSVDTYTFSFIATNDVTGANGNNCGAKNSQSGYRWTDVYCSWR